MNGQNNNQNHNVKNKFFTQELYDSANLNDVGSASTNGHVISWGVGGNKNKFKKNDDINLLDSTQMFNFVNTEITDFEENNEYSKNKNKSIVKYNTNTSSQMVSTNQNVQNNMIMENEIKQIQTSNYGTNISAPISNSTPNNIEPASNMAYYQPSSQNNIIDNNNIQMQQNTALNTNNNTFNTNIENNQIDDNTLSHQPLSLLSLSGDVLEEEQRPKEINEEKKYFQNNNLENNNLKIDNTQINKSTPVVDLLAEPVRELNNIDLVKAYVGPNYSEFSMYPFSFWGAFFNSTYFFYRKMYIQGVILSIINYLSFVMTLKSSWWLSLIVSLVVFIITGLLTNSLYLIHAKTQVAIISKMNPKMSQVELQQICQKKGGTSIVFAMILTIIASVLTSTILNPIFNPYSNLLELKNKITETKKEVVKLDKLVEYKIPKEFTFSKKDKLNAPYKISEKVKIKGEVTKINSCNFNISVINTNDSAETYLQKIADSEKRYNRIKQYKDPNKLIWTQYSYDNNDYQYILLSRDFKHNVVLIRYLIHKNASEGMCEDHLKTIMKSIKEK